MLLKHLSGFHHRQGSSEANSKVRMCMQIIKEFSQEKLIRNLEKQKKPGKGGNQASSSGGDLMLQETAG